ncbi:three-prime repair exonuclease 1-like [Eriocheir sinensis]|uniref:three-prime repair exonuclease 1-like n=1 Tax=Eriocheir sinensis TaxID=95602 RepID=UPI0021C7D909|nr:three-prime repair exonuclease 1-like [Eriocheir sinensis]
MTREGAQLTMRRSAKAKKIQSFVFLDLETTGLSMERPHITELSMVAVSRADLLAMRESASTKYPRPSTWPTDATARPPKVPRVTHRYVRLYNPYKVISPIAGSVSGLCNEDLECLSPFSEESAKAIKIFLKDLQWPVALVAHNGNAFDFPLLMAELHRALSEHKLRHVLCVDTLHTIRRVDQELEISELVTHFTEDNFWEEHSQDVASPAKRPRTEQPVMGEDSLPPCTLPSHHVSASPGQAHLPYSMAASVGCLETPTKSALLSPTSMPTTPAKPVQPPPQPWTPKRSQPGTLGFQAGGSGRVHRALTFGNTGGSVTKAPSYRQTDIYRRLFNSNYEAHKGQEDCLALLQICGHYGAILVELFDASATWFTEVQPMWK